MKTKLHPIAVIVCLLTILASLTSCVHIAMATHQQAASSHCPMHLPQNEPVPSCCSATHPPPATIATAEMQHPVFLSTTFAPLPPDHVAPRLSPLPTQFTAPPPLPPRIALRI